MPRFYRTVPDLTPEDIARFWSHVDKDGPVPPHRPDLGSCWLWTATRSRKGYGSFCVGGGMYAAPRIALQITSGAQLPPLFACHHCDNPPCVNPAHLFLGTNTDNIHDARAKGRLATGERSGSRLYPERLARGDANYNRQLWARGEATARARLTVEQVREIRAKAAAGTSHVALAREYGVHANNISFIVHRKTWTNLL